MRRRTERWFCWFCWTWCRSEHERLGFWHALTFARGCARTTAAAASSTEEDDR